MEIPINALELASRQKKANVAKALLKAGASAKDNFALAIAVFNDDVEMAKILIGAKANVNDEFVNGQKIVELAKSDEMRKLLKKAGAVVPFHGDFVSYCENEDLSVNDVLEAIKGGADVNEVDANGWTPLHAVAEYAKDAKLVDLLVKRGAIVNATSPDGWTPFALAAKNNPNPAILKNLVKNGADVSLSPQNEGNWDALFYAVAYNSNPAVVATLLQMGLDENYSDQDKNTLVVVAIKNNPNEKILLQLFKSGYKANPENSWWTNPLEAAIEEGKDIKFIKLLLQAHAQVTDAAIREVQNLSPGKYRNQLTDLLIRAKRKQK